MNIDGINYEVVSRKSFEAHGETRTALTLRRPKGRRFYFAVVYANGVVSGVV